MRMWLALAGVWIFSCTGDTNTVIDTGPLTVVDGDGDGFDASDGDCDDEDAAVSPSAPEVCDGVDNNCDGLVDEGVTTRSFADTDGDGFGDPEQFEDRCDLPTGYVANANDCDDSRDTVFPGNTEVCDELDNDCDDDIDEGVQLVFYADADEDNFGDNAQPTSACQAPAGYVVDNTDCDDADDAAFPGGVEVCDLADNNCDGAVDEGVTTTFYQDVDADNYGVGDITTEACERPSGYADRAGDCDDSDPIYNPEAPEDDCTDPNDYNCDGSVRYADVDEDGWAACVDCNDNRADINPDQAEICNDIDDDCDTDIDDDDDDVVLSTGRDWFADTDRDGFGDAGDAVLACDPPEGYVGDDTDCDDERNDVNPDRTEICNDIDDNCDDFIDDADADVDLSTGTIWYRDADEDGYGNPGATTQTCDLPSGYVTNDADCNDSDDAISPVGVEICDDIDNDCDTKVDDDDEDVTDQSTWYSDADSDGYGNPSVTTLACDQPAAYVGNSGDCNDGSSVINPAATEVCNDTDDDCDGRTDDADSSLNLATATTWYRDADGDGYGVNGTTVRRCDVPGGYVNLNNDCNDGDRNINPGAAERCDGRDNNCNSRGDEGLTCSYRLTNSGGGALCVDDDFYVDLRGSRIFSDSTWGAGCVGTVSFNASPGDTVRVFAIDDIGGCREMSSVYITHLGSGVRRLFLSGYSRTCGHGASGSPFWDRSAAVPGIF